MPELPEVETTKQSLSPLIGLTVNHLRLSGHRLREPIPYDLDRLIGKTLISVHRRAKYLLLTFCQDDPSATGCNKNKASEDLTLLIHLGMSGSLQQHHTLPARKHDHMILAFDDPKEGLVCLHYHDPRRFGMVMWAKDADRFLTKLGAEPLDDVFNAHYLHSAIHRPNGKSRPITRPIKTVIMDQSIVVGVGNIYATESLFLSAIAPAAPAHLLSLKQLATLVSNIKMVLAKSIAVGGSSLKDFTVGSGQTGYFQQTLLVYGRQGKPCTRCHFLLENVKIAGRASVFCPNCQPLADI